MSHHQSKSFFKPLIASSLALALGVSVASAEEQSGLLATLLSTTESAINNSSGTTDKTFDQDTTITAGTGGFSILTSGSSSVTNVIFNAGGTIQGNIKVDSGGTNTINFNGTGTNTIQGIISNYGGTTNVTFASGTNTITGNNGSDSGDGGIYTKGGNTIITFKGGTNIIEGLVGNDNGTSDKYNSIVNQGGTLTINLESGTLSIQGTNGSSGNLFHRVYGGTTTFNVSNSSSLTLKNIRLRIS